MHQRLRPESLNTFPGLTAATSEYSLDRDLLYILDRTSMSFKRAAAAATKQQQQQQQPASTAADSSTAHILRTCPPVQAAAKEAAAAAAKKLLADVADVLAAAVGSSFT